MQINSVAADNKPVVIFGISMMAEVAFYHFCKNTVSPVVAFTVSDSYIKENSFLGKPVVPFSRLHLEFPPSSHNLFVAVGYSARNSGRRTIMGEAKALGYDLVSYISPQANINSEYIGENCFILDSVIVEPYVKIGNGVVIWSGSVVCHHGILYDYIFIGPNATIAGNTHIGEQCFVGAGAVIRDGVRIAPQCKIGAGALILSDCAESGSVYMGACSSRL